MNIVVYCLIHFSILMLGIETERVQLFPYQKDLFLNSNFGIVCISNFYLIFCQVFKEYSYMWKIKNSDDELLLYMGILIFFPFVLTNCLFQFRLFNIYSLVHWFYQYFSFSIFVLDNFKNKRLFSRVMECSICFESCGVFVELPCNHFFHETCIQKWFCMKKSLLEYNCPLCRQNIYKISSLANNDTTFVQNNRYHIRHVQFQ